MRLLRPRAAKEACRGGPASHEEGSRVESWQGERCDDLRGPAELWAAVGPVCVLMVRSAQAGQGRGVRGGALGSSTVNHLELPDEPPPNEAVQDH
jgi:hypothetical protein